MKSVSNFQQECRFICLQSHYINKNVEHIPDAKRRFRHSFLPYHYTTTENFLRNVIKRKHSNRTNSNRCLSIRLDRWIGYNPMRSLPVSLILPPRAKESEGAVRHRPGVLERTGSCNVDCLPLPRTRDCLAALIYQRY
jgi:hypothetical protein